MYYSMSDSSEIKIPYADILAIVAGAFISKQLNLSLLPTIGVSLAASAGVSHMMKLKTSYVHDAAMKALNIDMDMSKDQNIHE